MVVKVNASQPCLTLRPGLCCPVHGILQARILEWVAFPFSRGSSQPRDQIQVSHIAGQGKPLFLKNGGVEGHALFSYKNSKITTCFWITIGRKSWIPPKKIPHVQGQRRRASEMVGGAKLCLESKPIPARHAWRAQTKPCVHQETPKILSQACLWVFEHLLWEYGSVVTCCRGRGSGCSSPGCGISPLGESHPTIEPLSRQPTSCRTIISNKFSHC